MRAKWAIAMAMSVALLLGGLAASPEIAAAASSSTSVTTATNHTTSHTTTKKKKKPVKKKAAKKKKPVKKKTAKTIKKKHHKKKKPVTAPTRPYDPRDHRHHGHHGHGPGHGQDPGHGQCSYPPVSAPAVSLAPSAGSVQPGQRFTFSGKVLVNSCGLGDLSVGIFISGDPNGPFIYGGSTHTNSNGEYWFQMTQPDTRYYEVVSAATACFNSSTSNVVTVYKGN